MPTIPITGSLANSVDIDQTPQNSASEKGLHCLHLVHEFLLNMILIKSSQTHLMLDMDRSKEGR